MKNIMITASLILATLAFFAFPSQAQSKSKNQTISFQVSGDCEHCKERIEEAAYIKGVKRAVWDRETKTLTVTFNSKKTSKDKIVNSIVNAGHDADGVKASDDVYGKLPACCHYREAVGPAH